MSAHLRENNKEPLFHTDDDKGNVANFLLFVKGEPLLNNGTGFMHNNQLASHIGSRFLCGKNYCLINFNKGSL